jgi:catechol 1,2-dioxygenase
VSTILRISISRDHPDLELPWYSLEYTFTMEEGEARLPPAPIR